MWSRSAALCLALAGGAAVSYAQPLGTAFTYQGRLSDGGSPAEGTYDLRFVLFDSGAGGAQQGPTATRDDVTVADGLFTVTLDFGTVFSGSKRWLEVAVRPGAGTGAYQVLSPRQELTPSPGALFAATAAGFAGSLAGEVTGTQGATAVSSAVSANNSNAIVRRDGAGSFSAGTVNLAGNLALPDTTSPAAGVVTKGGVRFLHGFGTDNTFVGASAGNTTLTGTRNTGAGAGALMNLTSGEANVAVGAGAGTSLASGSGNIYLASPGAANESQTIRIGEGQTATFLAGIFGQASPPGTPAVFVEASGRLATRPIVVSDLGTGQLVKSLNGQADSVTLAAAAGSGLSVSSGGGAVTITSNAGASNVPGTIVARDGAGNFSAGTITATLNGNVTGSAAGFTGGLAGDVSGPQGETRVAQIQGRRVSAAAPADGQVLKYHAATERWAPASAGLAWQVVSGNTQQAQPNTGYVVTSDARVTLTLPAAPSVGDVVRVSGAGPGGWKIAQNEGQAVRLRHLPSSGSNWTPRESDQSWAAVASSADGSTLVAAIGTGGWIYTSADGGASWRPSAIHHHWSAVASSADGSALVAMGSPSPIYTSTDGGATWTPRTASSDWRSVASSADGSRLVAGSNGNQLYTSTDGGATWTARGGFAGWRGVASSADGSTLVAVAYNGQIYTSTDAGVSWTPRETNRRWISVASSADGSKLAAAVENGQIYTSADAGVSWTPRERIRDWASIASSADGRKLVAAVESGQIYTSTDAGVSWTPRESNRAWWSVASSADGTKLVAVVLGGYIYTSSGAASATTTPGPGGYLLAEPSSALELQYVGGGMFLPLSHEGVITGR